VEGESLFNDVSALVLVSAILVFATSSQSGMDGGFLSAFAITFLGGVVLGALIGLVAAIAVLLLGNSPASNIVLLINSLIRRYGDSD
jgi:CPA1 family monovalent cation:H+ antiporter